MRDAAVSTDGTDARTSIVDAASLTGVDSATHPSASANASERLPASIPPSPVDPLPCPPDPAIQTLIAWAALSTSRWPRAASESPRRPVVRETHGRGSPGVGERPIAETTQRIPSTVTTSPGRQSGSEDSDTGCRREGQLRERGPPSREQRKSRFRQRVDATWWRGLGGLACHLSRVQLFCETSRSHALGLGGRVGLVRSRCSAAACAAACPRRALPAQRSRTGLRPALPPSPCDLGLREPPDQLVRVRAEKRLPRARAYSAPARVGAALGVPDACAERIALLLERHRARSLVPGEPRPPRGRRTPRRARTPRVVRARPGEPLRELVGLLAKEGNHFLERGHVGRDERQALVARIQLSDLEVDEATTGREQERRRHGTSTVAAGSSAALGVVPVVYRSTRAPPATSLSTSASVAMDVSPGVVMASAPCAHP